MRVCFLLIDILFDKFFRAFESIIFFLALTLECNFAFDFVLDGSLVTLSLLHDVSQNVLLATSLNRYSV